MWFDALHSELQSVGEEDPSPQLRADIPTPILHCVLARRRVIDTADKYGITSNVFQPCSTEPEPVLPALDFRLNSARPSSKHKNLRLTS